MNVQLDIPMQQEEQKQVALIAFCLTVLADLANRTDKKQSFTRHNRLVAAIEKVRKVDQTYQGYIPNFDDIEKIYEEFDNVINKALKIGEQNERD